MRVLQLVMSRQYRGVELFTADLSAELVKAGDEVLYVALYAPYGKEFIPTGVKFIDLNLHKSSFPGWKKLSAVRKCFQEFNPDIVQANSGDTLKYAVLVKFFFGLKFRIVFRNASMVGQYLRNLVQKQFNRFLYKRVDKVISISGPSRAELISVFPFIAERITLLPNAINTAVSFKKLPELDPDSIHIIHIGGFTFEKNHAGLLRIFQQVRKRVPNAKLWMAGEGPLLERISRQVNELGLSGSVRLLGSVSNPLDYIISSNVLVLPSNIEGLPGVILEAFYARTPVVAYDVGGVSEVVRNGETGWLVPKGDEGLFSDAIVDSIHSPLRAPITETAYNLVVESYSSQQIAIKFRSCYRELIHGKD